MTFSRREEGKNDAGRFAGQARFKVPVSAPHICLRTLAPGTHCGGIMI